MVKTKVNMLGQEPGKIINITRRKRGEEKESVVSSIRTVLSNVRGGG
jgi:hypothetical protein